MTHNDIICIGRQIGSGGLEIARLLSQKFSIPFYDKELLELSAKESGLSQDFLAQSDEMPSKSFFSGLPTMNLSVFSDGGLSSRGFWGSDQLFRLQSDQILKIASQGSSIFVGRCADYVLRDHPGMLSVFISADHEDRLGRLQKARQLSREDAQKLIERVDRKRSAYYNYYTYQTWGAAKTYDLCVNSSRLGIEGTAEMIASFIRTVQARSLV